MVNEWLAKLLRWLIRPDLLMYSPPFPDDAHVRAIGWNGFENRILPEQFREQTRKDRSDSGVDIIMRHYDIRDGASNEAAKINMGGQTMTKGEMRVGINFNPSSNVDVETIKQQAADLIDFVDTIKPNDEGVTDEVGRLKALAQTRIEEAAMWAVKAATKKSSE